MAMMQDKTHERHVISRTGPYKSPTVGWLCTSAH